eukprot:GEMP01124065.1.p1 GENE.GEMP01124065.1~~GEMP01124065.1.p1  ORF type:complete len:120 (-),score=4.80 GEMP01124065.1:153-512(-)
MLGPSNKGFFVLCLIILIVNIPRLCFEGGLLPTCTHAGHTIASIDTLVKKRLKHHAHSGHVKKKGSRKKLHQKVDFFVREMRVTPHPTTITKLPGYMSYFNKYFQNSFDDINLLEHAQI